MLDVQSSTKAVPTAAVANPVLSGSGLLTVNIMRYRNAPAICQALRVTLSLLPWQSCTVSVNWAAVVPAAGVHGGFTHVFIVPPPTLYALYYTHVRIHARIRLACCNMALAARARCSRSWLGKSLSLWKGQQDQDPDSTLAYTGYLATKPKKIRLCLWPLGSAAWEPNT